jgi:hypothetical protein
MSERTRDFLKPQFRDGERPSGADFADLIDSFVNKQTDGVALDTDGNLVLTRGVRLGDSAGTTAGGLRFNSNQLQVFTGGVWTNVSGGGGGGQFGNAPTAGAQPGIVRDSFVGIGNFPAAPTFKLEVQLDANNGPGNQARFGNVVCANGTGATAASAVVSHQNHATPTDFALRQAVGGAVQLNAPAGQILSLTQGGGAAKLAISATGNVIVGGQTDLAGAPAGAVFQVSGGVFKSPSNVWGTSDERVKEDVRDLDLGLSALRQLRPVRFRYNGRAGTPAGRVDIGLIAQEIETVVPETVQRVNVPDDPGLGDMRVFDPAALTYVLINAVKELAARVEQLEQALAVASAPATASSPVVG